MTTIRIKGPHSVKLVINDGDPDTPAMVYGTINGRQHSSTYHCALDNGIDDAIDLTASQLAELETHEDAVNAAYATARANHPEYN